MRSFVLCALSFAAGVLLVVLVPVVKTLILFVFLGLVLLVVLSAMIKEEGFLTSFGQYAWIWIRESFETWSYFFRSWLGQVGPYEEDN